MMIPRRVSSLSLVAMLIALAILPASGLAQGATPGSTPDAAPEPPSFLLEPVGQDGSYFTVTVKPGESQELTVALGNGGKEPVDALTYVSDAYTLVNGGFGVRAADEPATGATTWIDYSTETLSLKPGERMERSFTVSVPGDAAPGQYISALSIQTAESIAVGDTSMLRQIIKKSVAVFIIVPGPETPGLEIGGASVVQSGSANSLVIDIRNIGNVYLNPEGTVTMTTADGKPVLTSPIAMGPVYAGMETTLELYIPTILATGDYDVAISLTDKKHDVQVEEPSLAIRVDQSTASATPEVAPVTIASTTIEPISSGDTLQAVNVTVSIDNTGSTIPNAKLTMQVMRDGGVVEDYPLNSALVVQTGTTELQQRYIPLAGWEPGDYTFSLTLEAVDPSTGQLTVLATQDVEDGVRVP